MVGDRGQEEFEEIRILGLEVPEDGVEPGRSAVSYTHLTLPTIYSV